METVKIFHIADVHLDAPFTNMSPTEADRARESLRSAFAASVLAASNRGVQLFLIAGDLFDSRYITPTTKEFVCDTFAAYPHIRFFICAGNHDPISFYNSLPLPPNVYVFSGKQGVRVTELGVCVYGAPFDAATAEASPFKGLPPLDASFINILVCHGDLGATGSPYAPFSAKELGVSGFDYVALGHIHKPSGVLCENGVHYAYSGCIEGRGFDEVGERGALFGTVGKHSVQLGFIPLSRRKYAVEEIDISGMEKRVQVTDAIRAVMARYDGNTHLRVVLTGTPSALIPVSADGFETGGSNPISIEIKDKSLPQPKLTEAELDNTLRGVYLRRMQGRLELLDPNSAEYAVCARALKLGLAALDGRDITEV